MSDKLSHYDDAGEGLWDYFVSEIEATLARICRHPLAWKRISRHARRCLAQNFPYGLIYVVEEERIVILAVMHLKMKPGDWKARLRQWRKKKST